MRVALTIALAVTGCVEPPPESIDATSRVEIFDLRFEGSQQLDVIIVIDDSPAMWPHAERLATNLADFAGYFDYGNLPSLQLAIVSSDLEDPPALVIDRHLADGSHVTSYDGTLANELARHAGELAYDAPTSRPLAAMRRAIETQPGLIRRDSTLVVVFLSAQDDTGIEPLVEDVAFLHERKAPSRLIVAGALGPSDARCTIDGAIAYPAPRLHRFVELFARHTLETLCRPDFTGVLSQLAELLIRTVPNPCFAARATGECAVEVDGSRVPACATAAAPCWRIAVDDRACPGAPHQLLQIPFGPVELPPSVRVQAQCIVE